MTGRSGEADAASTPQWADVVEYVRGHAFVIYAEASWLTTARRNGRTRGG